MDKLKQKYLIDRVNTITHSQLYERCPKVVEPDYIIKIRQELAAHEAKVSAERQKRNKAIQEAKTSLLDAIYFKDEGEILFSLEKFNTTTFGL